MKKTLIPAILALSSGSAVLLLDSPFETKSMVVLALLLIASALGIASVLKASTEALATTQHISEQFSAIRAFVKHSETATIQEIQAQLVALKTDLAATFNTFSGELVADQQRNRELIDSRIAGIISELIQFKDRTLAAHDHMLRLHETSIQKGAEINSRLLQQEKNLATASATQQRTLEELGQLTQKQTQFAAEFGAFRKHLDTVLQEGKQDLAAVGHDFRRQINEGSTIMSSSVAALGAAITSQTQALASLFAHPTKDGTFGVDLWAFEDGNISKSYTPGRLLRVVNRETDTVTEFKVSEDGKTVTSDVFIGEVLRYRTLSSVIGAPIQGWEFGREGQVKVEYTYDDKGQLANRKAG